MTYLPRRKNRQNMPCPVPMLTKLTSDVVIRALKTCLCFNCVSLTIISWLLSLTQGAGKMDLAHSCIDAVKGWTRCSCVAFITGVCDGPF